MKTKNNIAVLLSTYNGEKYIFDLLDSLSKQTNSHFDLIVRDDGSTDGTVDIINKYRNSSCFNIHILNKSENLGSTKSFLELLKYANSVKSYLYFFFCDQDDVWHHNKIEKSVNKIKDIEVNNSEIPVLVHSDLRVVDSARNKLFSSFWKFQHIDPDRNNISRLVIQNTVTGCTLAMNRQLSEKVKTDSEDIIVHDWWIAMIASIIGTIVPINDTLIDYRQHEGNVIGARKYSYYTVFLHLIAMLIKSILSSIMGKHYHPIKDSLFKIIGIKKKKSSSLKKKSSPPLEFSQQQKQAKDLLNLYSTVISKDDQRSLSIITEIHTEGFISRKKKLLLGGYLPKGLVRSIRLLLIV
jgi:glycosyltransferase involved in cell wall biosynthesis